MVEVLIQKGLHGALDISVVDQPAGLRSEVHFALDGNGNPETMAVHTSALVSRRRMGQPVGGLEGEFFNQLHFHSSRPNRFSAA